MATLDMKGTYLLNDSEIDKRIKKTSPGNYALGRLDDNTFIVNYVGRSDNDLNNSLKEWVKKYKRFKFRYAKSPNSAYEKECKNYHDFVENDVLDNDIHPQKPEDSSVKCPVCNQ